MAEQSVVLVGFEGADRLVPQDVKGVPMDLPGLLPEAPILGILLDSTGVDAEATMRRRVDVNKALGRGATVLVFVGPDGESGAGTPLGGTLVSLLDVAPYWPAPCDIEPLRHDLKPYFDDHLAHALWPPGLPDGAEVLARVGDAAVSLRFTKGRSTVYFVPLRSRSNSASEARRFVKMLPDDDEYPDYLDEVDLGGEAEARAEGVRLTARLKELDEQLEAGRRSKRILYFKQASLQAEVVRFLTEEVGVDCTLMGGNKEDFWLEDAGSRWCIGEVKGRENANVTKGDVNAVSNHRSDRELGDEYPALLVVNTFSRRESVAARDEALHPDVIRRAAEDHVVIVRTLDLVRIRRALLAGDETSRDSLIGTVRSGGGWFEVATDGHFTVHSK